MFSSLALWDWWHRQPDGKECEICFESYAVSGNGEPNKASCPDGHTFCADCFRKYAEEAIRGRGQGFVQCMAPKCKESYSEGVMSSLLDPNVRQRMRENAAGQCSNSDPKMDSSVLSAKDRERLKREEEMTNRAIRRCPGCKKAIMKDGGCNHVACSSCPAHMCFKCGVQVSDDDYTHVCSRASLDPMPQFQRQYRQLRTRQFSDGFVRFPVKEHEFSSNRNSVTTARLPTSSLDFGPLTFKWFDKTPAETRLQGAVQLTGFSSSIRINPTDKP